MATSDPDSQMMRDACCSCVSHTVDYIIILAQKIVQHSPIDTPSTNHDHLHVEPQPPAPLPHHPRPHPEHLSAIRSLFRAYVQWLNIDLTFQDFETELNSLPGKYGAAYGGDLLLAYSSSSSSSSTTEEPNIPLGCVALRPLTLRSHFIDPSRGGDVDYNGPEIKYCEMKRLYVSPEARRMGLGKALVEAVVQRARELGYQAMRLDTLRTMEGPLRLYRAAGFVDVGPYYETPLVEETVFLGLDLRGTA